MQAQACGYANLERRALEGLSGGASQGSGSGGAQGKCQRYGMKMTGGGGGGGGGGGLFIKPFGS